MTTAHPALPAARIPDPRTAPPLRWGIIGSGWIGERFVTALTQHTAQQVVAVGSRSKAVADQFADRFGIPRRHGSYAELLADPDVDVVYIATPHNTHHPVAIAALTAGKPIVVEKPMALNASQVSEIAALATERGLFCMEAMWSFFLPKFDVLRQVVGSGMLGTIHTVLADNGESFTPDHRIMRHDLAGGPLLDLGTYVVSFAVSVLGVPTDVVARGQLAPSGVNGQTSAVLRHAGDAQSVLHTTLFSNTPCQAVIAGSAGTLTVPGVFYRPGPLHFRSADQGVDLGFDEPESGYSGLAYQAAEAARCISAGALESPVRPLSEVVATLAVIDEIRRQIGVVFVEEE